MDREPSRSGARPWWPVALAVLPLLLLAWAAWCGRRVRPGADDWCFLPVVRDRGLPGIVDTFYNQDNGRLVNALLVWVYARFGVAGQQWFAAVSGLLVVVALWAFCAAAFAVSGRRVPRGVPLLVAAVVAAVFLLGSRDVYKTYYWPASSVSHTLPPVFACAAVVPALRARSRRGRVAAAVVAALVGAGLGLLSEETSVVAALALVAAVPVAGRVAPAGRRGFVRGWCAAGLAGVAAGSVALYLSPGAAARRQAKDSATMLTPRSLGASLHAFAHIAAGCVLSWPSLAVLGCGAVAGCLLARTSALPVARARASVPLVAACAAVLLVAGYVCTVITYPVFHGGVVSAERLWNDYLLLYLLLLVCLGVLAGSAWYRHAGRTAALLSAGAVLVAAVSVALVVPTAALDSDLGVRARGWDAQDARIRAEAAAGARVVAYRRQPIRGLLEPFGNGGRRYWPGGCVADYYRVDRITEAS